MVKVPKHGVVSALLTTRNASPTLGSFEGDGFFLVPIDVFFMTEMSKLPLPCYSLVHLLRTSLIRFKKTVEDKMGSIQFQTYFKTISKVLKRGQMVP